MNEEMNEAMKDEINDTEKIEISSDNNIITKIGLYQATYHVDRDELKVGSYLRARDKAANELAYEIVDNMQHTESKSFNQGYDYHKYHTFEFTLLLEDERYKLKNTIKEMYFENNRLISKIIFLQKQTWYERLFLRLKLAFN